MDLPAGWVQDDFWRGNPSLGFESYTKRFPNPLNNNKQVPVTTCGLEGEWNFVVSAGANSDFSYSGYCVNCQTIHQAIAYAEAYRLFR